MFFCFCGLHMGIFLDLLEASFSVFNLITQFNSTINLSLWDFMDFFVIKHVSKHASNFYVFSCDVKFRQLQNFPILICVVFSSNFCRKLISIFFFFIALQLFNWKCFSMMHYLWLQWSVFVRNVAPTWESVQDKSTSCITSATVPITTLPNSITCIEHLRKETSK